MQDIFDRATHSAFAAGRPIAERDDRVYCIQKSILHTSFMPFTLEKMISS